MINCGIHKKFWNSLRQNSPFICKNEYLQQIENGLDYVMKIKESKPMLIKSSNLCRHYGNFIGILAYVLNAYFLMPHIHVWPGFAFLTVTISHVLHKPWSLPWEFWSATYVISSAYFSFIKQFAGRRSIHLIYQKLVLLIHKICKDIWSY